VGRGRKGLGIRRGGRGGERKREVVGRNERWKDGKGHQGQGGGRKRKGERGQKKGRGGLDLDICPGA